MCIFLSIKFDDLVCSEIFNLFSCCYYIKFFGIIITVMCFLCDVGSIGNKHCYCNVLIDIVFLAEVNS